MKCEVWLVFESVNIEATSKQWNMSSLPDGCWGTTTGRALAPFRQERGAPFQKHAVEKQTLRPTLLRCCVWRMLIFQHETLVVPYQSVVFGDISSGSSKHSKKAVAHHCSDSPFFFLMLARMVACQGRSFKTRLRCCEYGSRRPSAGGDAVRKGRKLTLPIFQPLKFWGLHMYL